VTEASFLYIAKQSKYLERDSAEKYPGIFLFRSRYCSPGFRAFSGERIARDTGKVYWLI